MKHNKNFNGTNGMKIQEALLARSSAAYELIKPKEQTTQFLKESRRSIHDRLENNPVKCAVLSGSAAYVMTASVMLFLQSKKKILTAAFAAAMTAAISGFTAYTFDKITLYERKNKKYNEYIARYAEAESVLSKSISDDTRLTKGAMLYRRDLRSVIRLLSEDLGYTNCYADSICFEHSPKSKKQLIDAICAEFGDIKAEYVSDIEKGTVIGILGEQIIINVENEESLKRINDSSEKIDEVFAVFGLKPTFSSGDALKDLVL